MRILLDTHAMLWWQAGGDLLSRAATRAIDRADATLVSSISFWELSLLVGRGRLTLGRALYRWVDDFLATQGAEAIAVDERVALTAGRLFGEGFGGDSADSLIYATAREHAVPLITKDRRISDFAAERRDVSVLW